MVQSKGWDWENAEKSFWLKPAEDSFYLANKWREKGYKHILDIGTGLGRHAIFFARQGFEVCAMDISEFGIEHLKTWAANEKLNFEAKTGDMLSLPYPDKSFDCVFACHVISHTDTNGLHKTVSEIERVLRPNGEVFLTFCSKETPEYLDEKADRVDENTILSQDEYELGIPHVHLDLDDIVSLLVKFDIEKVRKIQFCRLDEDNLKAGHHYYVNAVIK